MKERLQRNTPYYNTSQLSKYRVQWSPSMPTLKAQQYHSLDSVFFWFQSSENTTFLFLKNRCFWSCKKRLYTVLGENSFSDFWKPKFLKEIESFSRKGWGNISWKQFLNRVHKAVILSNKVSTSSPWFSQQPYPLAKNWRFFVFKKILQISLDFDNRFRVRGKIHKKNLACKPWRSCSESKSEKPCKTFFRSLIWEHPDRFVSRIVLKGDLKHFPKSKTVSSK